MIINVIIYDNKNDVPTPIIKCKKIKTYTITNNNIIRSEESIETLPIILIILSNNIEDILESVVQINIR